MITILQVILRVCAATVLGGIVGMERERSERAAGLRTHAMVGLGAAAFMLISAFGFHDILGAQNVALDPSRVAAQIVTGIGFLGAGTIVFQREMVRGLTTAASIWAVAAIGAAVGGDSLPSNDSHGCARKGKDVSPAGHADHNRQRRQVDSYAFRDGWSSGCKESNVRLDVTARQVPEFKVE